MSKEAGIVLMRCVPIPIKRKVINNREIIAPENPTLLWSRRFFGCVTPVNWNSVDIYPEGMLVDEARNFAVEQARLANVKLLFFVDYDVIIPPNALIRLVYDLEQHKEIDVVCGVYTNKSDDVPQPLIFKKDGEGPYWDWKIGEFFEIGSCHCGCTLIRMSAFDKIDKYLEENNIIPKPKYYETRRSVSEEGVFIGTEDLHYCKLLREAGGVIYADTEVLCGHQDLSTHKVYGVPLDSGCVKKSWMKLKDENKTIALDLGCGDTINTFPEYDATLRVDIREEVNPDYRCNLRHLPFPNEFADHVFSSHTLEHFGRWEVKEVLEEWMRVLKFGGKMRLVVPNIMWAARELIKVGNPDAHVLNVFYGAQEQHGYERNLNTHYVAFSKDILIALVEECGMEVISCEDDTINPALGYNIVLDAQKSGLKIVENDNHKEDVIELSLVEEIKID